VNNKELKEHFPFLFTDYNHKQFETADVAGVNKVSLSEGDYACRGCLNLCMTLWIEVVRDGDHAWG
jgi:hypothetical protein